ncbi:TatD family hydrolase [Roseibacillus ishigakijimensis]|uniref:TatD family hydrolase n=1 Tax=Roseibacillus ishigakijimensis TaxID=454146 RepID=A0A934RRX7_9BACT|nr:TatD family hydrolase [Roseibacillus ishigakijimensis]MBK1834536.1 TatD family hydrolase [Roseibacillus ishigakijimensis]
MIDAHNHLQQFADPETILATARAAGVERQLVNGTCEEDWPRVRELCAHHPDELWPSFGLHPWEVPHRSPQWASTLRDLLAKTPHAALGECGLDRWKKPHDLPTQVDCLQIQIDLAKELDRPLTIHCLQAWGPLLALLQKQDHLPPFLIHAFSGSREMMAEFASLGAYFSFNGFFLHERKALLRETYREIPPDRLLLESDAPAMLPPPDFVTHPLPAEQNHPANLPISLQELAKIRSCPTPQLARQLEQNFHRWHRQRAH